MSRASKYWLLAGAAFFLACSSNLETINRIKSELQAQLKALEQRISDLENLVKNKEKQRQEQSAALTRELAAVRDSLAALRAYTREREDRLNKQDINLDSQIALLTDEIREFEERVLKGGAPAPGKTTLDIRATYNKGMRYYNNRKYKQAIQAFEPISYPAIKSDLADNAQYWIGECYYYLKEYQKALENYQKVLAFAKTNKDDDALVRMGFIHLKLGDREKALAVFKKIVVDFPHSEYVKDAKKKCAELENQLKLTE